MSEKDISTVIVAMNIMYETENQLKPLLKRHNLSLNEWFVLKIVYLEYAFTPSEVAAYLNMQRASVTRHVEYLCTKGLLDRLYSKEDRRTVDLTVTKSGKKVCKIILSSYANILSGVTSRLDDEDKLLWSSILENKKVNR